ncbi:MAG TPA: MarR family winged helix-turn-helix transcriptional regulator [Paraburkholderia sp.]|nr:MarR family winged helix-turn-helix transcriptional regulator [Paraburkholderia sp.]
MTTTRAAGASRKRGNSADAPAASAPASASTFAADDDTSEWRHTALEARPGFLIRRLHQIHVALFIEECAPEGITPVQYSILTALDQMGPSEQIALSRAVGLDRANTADVIGRLAERRFIQRRGSRTDKRKKVAELTDVGRALLARLEVGVERAHERTLAALPARDRKQFMTYLMKLVETNNELSRTPIHAGSKSGSRSGDEPDDELDSNAGHGPGDKPGNRPGDRPGNRPGNKRGVRAGNDSGDKPSDKPRNRSANQPVDKPGSKPTSKAGNKPDSKSRSKRDSRTGASRAQSNSR